MQSNILEKISQILTDCEWLDPEISVTGAEVAGDGNMNLVERINLSSGESVILKRAHAWVQKFPDIAAPIERSAVEAAFYQAVAGTDVAQNMPAHLGFSAPHAANVFEDIGAGLDGSGIYQSGYLEEAHLAAVTKWLTELHRLPPPDDPLLINDAMRQLNAFHIFDFPLESANGFDLDAITPGLQRTGDRLKNDRLLQKNVQQLKSVYLAPPSGVLLHGDMYPASWLVTGKGVFVIDPEFCWIGPAAWDLGILAAHLALAGVKNGETETLYSAYGLPVDHNLANRFTGVEIMRRLIGIAQLPVSLDIHRKNELLDRARQLIIIGR